MNEPMQRNHDGSWSPAQEMPFMCEIDDCDCLEDVKPYKQLPQDTDKLDAIDKQNGWDEEPIYLCKFHSYGHEPADESA